MESDEKSLTPYIDAINIKDHCPSCHVDLIDKPIPYELRRYYSSPYYYSRRIGIYDINFDKLTAWKCPECNYKWYIR